MSITRRECLRMGVGSAAVLACGNGVPGFLLHAAPSLAAANSPTNRILVVLELDGGNDGLNTVVPYGDETYYRNRPVVNVASNSVLKIDHHLGFHPALQGFAELLQDEQLAVIQSVGYPNPTRSHFSSMSIWHAAQLGASMSSQGWLSRYLDESATPGGLDAPAIQVDSEKVSLALAGGRIMVPDAHHIEQIERRLGVPAHADPAAQAARLDAVLEEVRGAQHSALRYVQQNTLVSFASSRRLQEIVKSAKRDDSSKYPGTGLAERLKTIAQLVKAGLSTRIYYTRLGGFDTHVNQLQTHEALLREVANSVRAFCRDLAASGMAERVLLVAFSEFGRRLKENAGEGTDHGTAGPVFLVGPSVRSGLYGPYPDLDTLYDQDPRHAIDFRQIYATILERWLNSDSSRILGRDFPQLDLL